MKMHTHTYKISIKKKKQHIKPKSSEATAEERELWNTTHEQ